MSKPAIEVSSVAELQAIEQARGRIQAYAATVKCILAQSSEFDEVEDFAAALVEAVMANASKDEEFVRSHVKDSTDV